MSPLPRAESSTVRAIYAAYEAAAESWDSLGISVGEANGPCDRQLWYSFRWCTPLEKHSGRQLRLFATGNFEEDRLVEDLQRIGVDVYGQQDKIRLVGSHVRGKCDGKAMGVPEAPKTEHLLEFKSSNAKNMKLIVKDGCKVAKPLHYGQCQLGMHAFSLSRCLYLVSCKDDDTLYAERIEYDLEWTLRLLARLERIINSSEPPARISDKPDWFECTFCKHKPICKDAAWPRVTCRSCLHSTPEMGGDGHWSCARWAKPISFDEQKEACPTHLHIPALVPGELVDSDEDAETVTYRLASGELWIDGASHEEAA
ncbi:oxidoreductase [Rhizobium sp. CBN3]|uniref:oxidoreductase n=1 Tax=Rhizobium sp. CBN3 TaxID=3058045 RepID=UPI002673846C|nr:oxidoreductase [Rhizobium sp. CBN3]MDO3431156.1 oxidoreductase [Rhizobium sp. CBN3]